MPKHVFTIGHSNHQLEEFLALLRRHRVNALLDVRSIPHSRYSPHFNKADLCESLRQAGIAYIFQGNRLGGRPDDRRLWEGGKPSWELIAASEEFKAGIDDLARNVPRWTVGHIAMMCSEENPERCHRRGLVAKALIDAGIGVQHIRGDGSVETEEQVSARLGESGPDILELLGFD